MLARGIKYTQENRVDPHHKLHNNIDRPTKHSQPFSKLTNLFSEWKVGEFCRLNKIYTVNELFFAFSLKKIIELKFVHEV